MNRWYLLNYYPEYTKTIPDKLFHRQVLETDCGRPVQYKYHLFDTKTGEVLGTMQGHPTLYNLGNKSFYPEVEPYKSFQIDCLKSNVRDSGNGAKCIKLAIDESWKFGCNGRVHLVASKAFDKKRPPHVFYKKMGFISNSPEMNKYLDNCIKYGRNVSSKVEYTRMYLPDTPVKVPKTTLAGKVVKFLGKLFRI